MYSEILYHGTHHLERLLNEGFSNKMFLKGMGHMKYGLGFYATNNKVQAKKYGDVVKVAVTLKNPFFSRGTDIFEPFRYRPEALTDYYKSKGHDGLVINSGFEVCVFDAKNIKVV